jgi:hypothetical protein
VTQLTLLGGSADTLIGRRPDAAARLRQRSLSHRCKVDQECSDPERCESMEPRSIRAIKDVCHSVKQRRRAKAYIRLL